MRPRTVLALAFVVYAIEVAWFVTAEFVVAGRSGPPIDDGWIYMAFARSLAMGEGVTYPGYDGPLCAVTGPVWNAVLAVAFWFAGPTVLAAKACGVACGALAVGAVARLGRTATGDAMIGALAALLLAATPRFVWGSLSIMEVPFYVAAVCFGIALHLERRERSLPGWLPALVVLCLAGWARPECFVFAVFATLHRWRVDGALACLALLAIYPAYHLAIYGYPLPTTFYAKASGGAPWSILRREGVGAAAQAMAVQPLHELLSFVSYLPTYLPMIVLGFVPGVRRAVRERSGVRFVLLVLVGFIMVRGLLGVVQPAFQYGRYFAHTWPLFAIVALFGFDRGRVLAWPGIAMVGVTAALWWLAPAETLIYAFDWFDPVSPISMAAGAMIFNVSAALGAVLLLGGALFGRSAPRPPLWIIAVWLLAATAFGAGRHGRNVRDTYALNVAMALKVPEIVPAGQRIACHDIGALGFFADRPMLDLAGLGSPEVAHGPRRANGSIDGGAVLAAERPRWLCLTEAMYDAVMGGVQTLPDGLIDAQYRATIEEPSNITLLGSRYQLMELTWAK